MPGAPWAFSALGDPQWGPEDVGAFQPRGGSGRGGWSLQLCVGKEGIFHYNSTLQLPASAWSWGNEHRRGPSWWVLLMEAGVPLPGHSELGSLTGTQGSARSASQSDPRRV